MKKNYLFIIAILFTNYLFAQSLANANEAKVIYCSDFHVSKSLLEIAKEFPVDPNKKYKKEESEDKENRKPQKFKKTVKDGPQYGNDSLSLQRDMGTVPGRAPIANWLGQNALGFRPFDPSGAAGPNHYVQMINSTTFSVFNKSTGVVQSTVTLGNLWNPATANAGDPIVLYDKAADRWFLAQFGSSSDNKIYIAISTSSNPLGTYYTYTFVSPAFPDYLKFSVWADGYYMTSNQAQKVFVFERSAMLAGSASARSIYQNFSPPQSGFFVPLPADASDGTLPTIGTPCPIFSYSDNGWGGSNTDAVNIYKVSVNWAPSTPTETITLAGNIPTAAFDGSYDANWNDISQPNSNQKLDGIGGTLMYRAQWKSWSGYNTVVLNWGVKISNNQRSIKWCELRQNQTTGVWTMYQEGIYTPDAATRWMGSIAMDNNGSIGLAYLKANSTSIYPGLYYTGRRSCDPLGTLPVTEETAIVGTGSQSGSNRNGDYAHTCLDPDGVTFWYTGEYMGGSSGFDAARTRIFSFQIPNCANAVSVSISQTAGSSPLCLGSSATFTAVPVNGGSSPTYQWKINGVNVGTNSPTYTTSSLTDGQVVTCVLTSNQSGVIGNPATSNSITVTVTTPSAPTVSISASSTVICAGNSVTFTASSSNGGTNPSYQWQVNGSNVGSNSSIYTSSTLSNGQIVTCNMVSNATCVTTPNASSNQITMVVNGTGGSTLNISASSTNICAGTSVTFTASGSNIGSNPVYQWKLNGNNVGTNSLTYTNNALINGAIISCTVTSDGGCGIAATLGTGTSINGTNSDVGVAYPTYYGNGRQQYLIRASELIGLGLGAGNITSLGFTLNNTIGDPVTLNGYTIKIGNTNANITTTTFQTATFTTVFGPINYTPTPGSLNTHTFNTPFYWNGTSNIIVDICFSNQVVGAIAYQNYQTSTAFFSTTYYEDDGAAGAGACANTGGTRASIRPNMKFSIADQLTANSNNITMTVSPAVTPSINIALSSGTNPMCIGASATFTASATNGGATPSYQWKINGNNVGTNSNTFTTSTLTNGQIVTCVLTSNANCAAPSNVTSNAITMTVNTSATPTITIALTSGTNPLCAGASATFTASATNGGSSPGYQWKINGNNVGTNSNTFITTSLTNGQIVTCVLTSNSNCISQTTVTSNAITMTVSTSVTPSVNIALTSGTNPLCAGASATFTASATNEGSSPGYQWKINGNNVGTNSNTFTTSTLTNGQIVTCVLNSNANCAVPSTATSNAIAMTVNTTLTPSINIALNAGTNPMCAGANATFSASVSNGGSTPGYQWKINGNNVGTNSNTFTTNTLTNGQIVTCVLTSNANCAVPSTATSNAITMIVNTSLTPSINIALNAGTNPMCAGASATFSASISNGGASPSYQWKINGNNVGTNSNIFTTNTLTNGQIVTCVLTSNANCAVPSTATSNAITMTVNTSATPTITIAQTSGTNPLCAGASATFTASATNGGSSPGYQWKINGNNVGTNNNTFTTSTLTNGQIVTCVLTSNANCAVPSTATSNAITMTVNTSLTPSINIALNAGTNPMCTGATATFSASVSNGGSTPGYQWKINGNNVGTNSNTFTTNTLTNGQIVTCVLTSNANCAVPSTATSNAITMIVNAIPASPVITANGPTTINLGDSVILNSNQGIGNIWSPGNENSTSITVTTSGTYFVTYTDANGCTSQSNSIVITVNTAVTPVITVIPNFNTPCSGITFSTNILYGGSNPQYQWKKNNTSIPGATNSTYTALDINIGDLISCQLTSNNPNANPAVVQSSPVAAQFNFVNTVWNGSINSDFHNNANWTNGIPDKNSIAIINSGAANNCILTQNAACYNLSIQNGINFIVDADVTLEIYGSITNDNNITCNAGTVLIIDCEGLVDGVHSINSNNPNSTILFHNVTLDAAIGVNLNTSAYLKSNLQLTQGLFTNNSSFRLISDIDETGHIAPVNPAANYSGNLTMERFVPGGLAGWAMIGNAVYNATINDWMDDFTTSGFTGASGNIGGFVSVYTYDESNFGMQQNGYVPASNATNTINLGNGNYVYLGTGSTNVNNITYDVTGPIQVGDYNLSLTHTPTIPSALPDHDGWNLIANPYPCAIDWDSPNWSKSGIDAAIYIYDADLQQFATYVAGSNGIGINGGNNIIASSQALWVKSNTVNPLLQAVELVKSTNNTTLFKSSSSSVANGTLQLILSYNNLNDESLIKLNDLATTNFDHEFDAYKKYSMNAQVPNISSYMNGIAYGINCFADALLPTEIPLELRTSQLGNYQLSINGKQGFANSLYLKDNLSSVYTPIYNDTTFIIPIADTNVVKYQYSLMYDNSTVSSLNTINNNGIKIYPNPTFDMLYISNLLNENLNVKIYNAVGEIVYLEKNKNGIDLSPLAQGVYFIEINNFKGENMCYEKFAKLNK